MRREERRQLHDSRRARFEQRLEQRPDARIGRARQLARRVELRDDALVEHADARRQRERFGHVVRDDDDGLADLRLDAPELAVQLGARDGIERAERLVHQQDRRIGGERARDADALALAARELAAPARSRIGRRAAGRRGAASRRRARRCAPRPSRAAAARPRRSPRPSCGERGRSPGARSRSGVAARRDSSSRVSRPSTITVAAVGHDQAVDRASGACSCRRRCGRRARASRRPRCRGRARAARRRPRRATRARRAARSPRPRSP